MDCEIILNVGGKKYNLGKVEKPITDINEIKKLLSGRSLDELKSIIEMLPQFDSIENIELTNISENSVGLYSPAELIKDKNVIVDFYAPWCPPCKIVANNLEDFDITKPENVHIYKVNIDDELTLAKKYGVTKLPTLIYFKDGKPIKDYVGVLSSEELLQASKENFK